jgi:thiamine biosynthesis lipoprotein
MGTKASITIYGMRREKALNTAGKAFHELHRIESIMSTWNSESEMSQLNSSAGERSFTPSAELSEIIRISIQFSEITEGAFDITARPLVQLWGFQSGAEKLPSEIEIKNTLKSIGYRKININAETNSITLPKGTQIDLAGVAKGYGVDRCVAILKREGVKSALVNLGGNIYAMGTPPGKNGWIVGIRDPRDKSKIVGYIILKNEAVATSGNYENFIKRGDKTIGHIIDPVTGTPISGNTLSVTVISPTATASDAISTGLFVLGPKRGINTLEQLTLNNSTGYISETANRTNWNMRGKYAGAVFIISENNGIKFVKSANLDGKLILE